MGESFPFWDLLLSIAKYLGLSLLVLMLAADLVHPGASIALLEDLARLFGYKPEPIPGSTGMEGMLNTIAVVRSDLDISKRTCKVFAQGALWDAEVIKDIEGLKPGDRVKIKAMDGLKLVVEAASEKDL